MSDRISANSEAALVTVAKERCARLADLGGYPETAAEILAGIAELESQLAEARKVARDQLSLDLSADHQSGEDSTSTPDPSAQFNRRPCHVSRQQPAAQGACLERTQTKVVSEVGDRAQLVSLQVWA